MCGNLHFLRYLSVYSKYWRSILAVYFGVYGRILRSIRPYTWSIRGLSTFHPCHHSHHLPLPLAFTHDPATPKHIVHTKEHHMSKAEEATLFDVPSEMSNVIHLPILYIGMQRSRAWCGTPSWNAISGTPTYPQFWGKPPKKWIQHPQKSPIPFLSPHNPHRRGGFFGGGQTVRAQLEQS